jgi:type I restriction enzyme S subunit
MSWELKSFNELGFIGRGKSRHRPRNDESLYGGIFPLIQTGDVKSANLYLTEYSQTYSQKGLEQSKLWEPNTLCITIAANIADTTILGIQACFPDSIIGFVANEELCDIRFIKYHFDIVQKQMQMVSQGATQDNLSLEKLLKFKVPTPPLPTQKRIASILSAYDDLIENNLKRIKLLEETAQNIYKEWFVNFRFPNYENTPFNKETGLPEGWEKKKVEDCIKVMKGKKPKKEYTSVGENRVLYLLVDVLERRELRYTEIDNVQLTSEGETLMLMDGSRSGMVFKSLEGAIGSTLAVFRIKNNVFGIDYCFNFFKHRETEIISKNTGSAIPHANKNYINGMEIPIPTEKICNEFEAITNKIYKQIEFLSIQNQKLKEARDILLPRLMNRTIEI